MRSDSLRRSSAAPRTIVSPSAKQPSSATSGSSSIASGTSSASTTVPPSGRVADVEVGDRLLRRDAVLGLLQRRRPRPRPCAAAMRRKPTRVQLTPTSCERRAASRARASPAAAWNAAEDGSPGTCDVRRPRARRCGCTVTSAPSRSTRAPGRRASARCGRGSAPARSTVVAPAASSPASSTHDLTCALTPPAARSRSRAAARRAIVSGGKRPSRRVEPRAHPPQRLGDPVDRAAADRLVAVEDPAPSAWPASQPGSSRISVPALPTSIDAGRLARRAQAGRRG